MSAGKDHTSATLGLACIFMTQDWTLGLYMLAGMILQPDLDVDGGYIGYALLEPIPPVYYFWRIYWYPYSRVIRHRSFLSHGPLIGTGIRLVYLFGPAYLIIAWIQGSWPLWLWILPLAKALTLTDFLHFVMDFYNPDRAGNFRSSN